MNADLMKRTGNPAAKFLHCLPAFHAPNTSVGTEIMNAVSMPDGLEVTECSRAASRPDHQVPVMVVLVRVVTLGQPRRA